MNDTLIVDSTVQTDNADTHVLDTCVACTVAEANQSVEACRQPGPWAPILIPTFSSIIVFILGWVFTRWFKRNDEKKTRSNYRKTVIDWIDLIIPIEEAFIRLLKELSENIRLSDDLQPVPYAMPQSIPDRLNELPLDTITDSFIRDYKYDKKRNIQLFNLISGLEYFSKMSASVVQTYETYNKQSFALCGEWNEYYISFVDELNSSPYIANYQATVLQWQTELLKKKDSVQVHLKYVEKLGDLADALKDNTMASYLNRLRIILRQSQSFNEGFAKNFKNMANMTSITLESVRQARSFFENK